MQRPAVDMGWRLAITFAVAALLFLSPWSQSMAQNILGLSTSLVDHGSVEIDSSLKNDVAERDGRTLSGLPPSASFIAALVSWLTRLLLWLLPDVSRLTALYVLCSILVGIPAAATTVYLTYLLTLRWGMAEHTAFLTAAREPTSAADCVIGAGPDQGHQHDGDGRRRGASLALRLAAGGTFPRAPAADDLAWYDKIIQYSLPTGWVYVTGDRPLSCQP